VITITGARLPTWPTVRSIMRILPAIARPSLLALALASAACDDDEETGDACTPDDLDGVIGGDVTFEVTIGDDAFSPRILTAQNRAAVTLTLTNDSNEARGFFVECLPTPNDDGCPSDSCFPDDARLDPIEPGASAIAEFEVPIVEGAYTIVSAPGETEPSAQFIVK
jgi:hypothetical protein